MADPFIGEIRIFAGNFAPRNWAFCNGQLLPISQNPALFSILGTTYGGDGRTTFQLPDLQGRLAMHPGSGPGLTARRLGQRFGSETETLTASQMANHRHDFAVTSDNGEQGTLSDKVALGRSRGGTMYNSAANLVQMNSSTLGSAPGGGGSHDNMQPFLAVNYIIALSGLYPSRS